MNIVVITGGAGGMGLATAKIMGKEKNIKILLVDINQDRLDVAKDELKKLNINSETVICDITNDKSVSQVVKKAKSLGVVKSLIHTAGISPQMGDAKTIAKINAIGTININKAFLEIATPGFAVVNIASMGGHQLPNFLVPSRSYKYAFTDIEKLCKKLLFPVRFIPETMKPGVSYAISKNFVSWYSKVMADKFGEKGARIVSVSPGSIDTSMGKLEKDHGAGSMADISALKRFGKPEEIAEVWPFLQVIRQVILRA